MSITGRYSFDKIAPDDQPYIDAIIAQKIDLAPWDMVEETHKAGEAWSKIFADGKGNHQVIPISLIKTC